MKKLILLIFIFVFTISYAQKNKNYLRIDFSSICCGPPSEKPITDYIEEFRKKNNWENFEIWQESRLGYEGEYSLFIGIDALDDRKKKIFISGLEKLISNIEKNRDINHDGNIDLRDKLLNQDELIHKQKTPPNEFSTFELRADNHKK